MAKSYHEMILDYCKKQKLTLIDYKWDSENHYFVIKAEGEVKIDKYSLEVKYNTNG